MTALHDTIKLQLPGAPRYINPYCALPKQYNYLIRWLIEVYSKIYYRAWRLSEGPYLQQIETHCLQDLMYTCLYSSRQKPSFFHTLQEVWPTIITPSIHCNYLFLCNILLFVLDVFIFLFL